MRRIIAALVVASSLPVAAAVVPASAAPTALYLSEYVEGSSNNKALELTNPPAAPIDLAAGGYAVRTFFNGTPAPG